jgi:hypothetical protein
MSDGKKFILIDSFDDLINQSDIGEASFSSCFSFPKKVFD